MAVFTFGLSLKGCVRLCALVGIFASSFYVTSGVTILTRAMQEQKTGPYSKPLYLYVTQAERRAAEMEKVRFGILVSLGTALIVVNVLQIVCDLILFQLSLKTYHGRILWVLFVLDIILWIITLICFVNVFPAGGLLLLTIVLVGTSVRCYILYIIHQYFSHLRKLSDSQTSLKVEEFRPKDPRDPFVITYDTPTPDYSVIKYQQEFQMASVQITTLHA